MNPFPVKLNVVILGVSGQLGSELMKNPLHVLHAYTHDELDLSAISVAELAGLLDRHQADVVINAAAYTAVDKAEEEIAAAYAINAYAVRKLAQACMLKNVRIIHVSTDYVFDGKSNVPYETHDTPAPINVYGASKALGESFLFQCQPDAVCLRTSWLYSRDGNNFVNTMLRLMNKSKVIRVVNDQTGCPTSVQDVAHCVWQIIDRPDVKGILHWTGAGQCSWYEFAQAIQQRALAKGLLSKDCKVIPVPSADYPVVAPRPAYSVLDCQATAELLNIPQRHWTEALDAMLDLHLHQ